MHRALRLQSPRTVSRTRRCTVQFTNVRADRRAIETWTHQPALVTVQPRIFSAVERVLADEGGYSSNPADPGGETRFGISARSNPGVNIATLTRDEADRNLLARMVAAVRICATAGRNRRQDFRSRSQHRRLYTLSNACGAHLRACGSPVTEAGTLGLATTLARRCSDPIALMAALRSEAAGHYRLVAANQKNGAEFLKGWLNRAYA